MFSREEIIKKLFTPKGGIFSRFKKCYPDMHQQIIDSFNIPDLDTLTAYYCWYHKIEPKICPTCGNSLSFRLFNEGYSEHPYCSKSCWPDEYKKSMNALMRIKIKQTNIERYGVEHHMHREEVKNKIKATNIERYGVENPYQSESIKDKIKETNLERFGVEYPSQSEGVKEKIKATNLERFGVEYALQNEEVREKFKATSVERYGVEYPSQYEEIKEKVKATNIERFGVESPMQCEEVRAKSKNTNLEKYGVENPTQSKEVKEKIKKTNLERYGVECTLQNKEVKDKIKATNLERFGVEYPSQSEEIKEKVKQTSLERFGVENPFQSEEVKAKVKKTNLEKYGVENVTQKHISPETIRLLNDRKEFETLCEKYKYNATLVGKELCVSPRTTLNHMRNHALDIPPNIRSYLEQELVSFIESLGITNYIVNDRRILNNKEIDLYLPDHKVGIEMDGVYWHSLDEESEINKKNNHRDKVLLAREKGIKLIQFFEDEWDDKRLICESIIKNALGLGSNRLYARKLNIREIPSSMAKTFCDNNHLSGGVFSKVNLGLFDGSILVQVATFSINRFSKDKHWELIRLCSAKNTTVVGGASRLIKKFFEITDADELVSFSDNRIGQGNVYKTIGFNLVSETGAGYFWLVDGVRYHRMKYQKHKLTEMDGYSPDKTEDMIMFENGHRKIYDSGNRKWVLKI